MQHCYKILPFILALHFSLFQGQKLNNPTYKEISVLFSKYTENDERAMVFVNMYLNKAKKDDNLKKMIAGYEEAIYYSKDVGRKLSYADSTVMTAKAYNDPDEIARAYLGKGIIYYYNRRQYKQALEEYIKAFKYSKGSHNDYLKNKITYHLGMVRSYLGYFKEASEHFEEAADHFERNIIRNLHPNDILNNESGYFNSIYRLSTCYKNLKLYRKEDSLINIGLDRLRDSGQLSLELAYFQKGKGIQFLRKGNADQALKYLRSSGDLLNRNQDYASLTTVYFHLGKLYWSKGDRAESLNYFKKVDSLVNRFWFVTPEIRSSYEYLINDVKKDGDYKRQLYYTNQLLKADSIINADFAMLSSKIYREYDTDTLLEEKKKLLRDSHNGRITSYIVASIGLLVIVYLIRRSRKKEKELNTRYQQLLEKFQSSKETDTFDIIPSSDPTVSSIYKSEIVADIIHNLKVFEEKKLYLQKDLTLPLVSKMIGSSRTRVSYVLNVHLDVTFPTYLKVLRINYITNLLLEDSKYLNYKIDVLVEKCGMSNRQLFSSHFKEVTGMTPTDFIRKRQQELKKL